MKKANYLIKTLFIGKGKSIIYQYLIVISREGSEKDLRYRHDSFLTGYDHQVTLVQVESLSERGIYTNRTVVETKARLRCPCEPQLFFSSRVNQLQARTLEKVCKNW